MVFFHFMSGEIPKCPARDPKRFSRTLRGPCPPNRFDVTENAFSGKSQISVDYKSLFIPH